MHAKLDMLFSLTESTIGAYFQRTVEKTADTLWSRILVPPQQATKNRAGCTAKQSPKDS